MAHTSSNRISISLAALPFMCRGQVTQIPMSPGSMVLALGLVEPSLLGAFHLPLLPFCYCKSAGLDARRWSWSPKCGFLTFFFLNEPPLSASFAGFRLPESAMATCGCL